MEIDRDRSAYSGGAAAGRRRRPSPLRGRRIGWGALVIAILAAFAVTGPGQAVAVSAYRFLEFYSGVFALVALSLTVMGGFVATDRLVLLARHRVSLQAAHRLVAVLAVSFLAIHIVLKVAEGHASVADVFVPFLSSHRRLFVGLGTVASYLMALLAWTGWRRTKFAHNARPWLWRALHVTAYPAWLLALVHGLGSGRHAATWVTASYVLCVAAVALGVLIRIAVARGRRGGAYTTGTVRAVPTATLAPRLPVAAHTTAPAQSPLPPPSAPPVLPPAPRRGDRPPSSSRRKPTHDISDDDFWQHMKGDTVQ